MKRPEGFVLVVTLLIMVVVGILALGASFTSLLDRQVSANQRGASSAYYVAHAGIQFYKTAIFNSMVEFYEDEGVGWCETPVSGGIDTGSPSTDLLPSDNANERWSNWIDFGPGQYRVKYYLPDTYMVLVAEGRVGSSQATVQLIATSGAGVASAWDNAIFANGESPGATINGNVAVYGSIHIVDGTLPVEEGAVSVTGTAGAYNTYIGRQTANTNIVSSMMTILGVDQATVQAINLCARVKVKSGSINISGTGKLGDSVAGREIYSVHLGNGNINRQNGNNLTPILNHLTSSDVYLKFPEEGEPINSGYTGSIDIGMPRPSTAYPDEIAAFSGVTALSIPLMRQDPANKCNWLVDGGIVKFPPPVIDASEIVVDLDGAGLPIETTRRVECVSGANKIAWYLPHATSHPNGYLLINGIINASDKSLGQYHNIEITGPTPHKTVLYQGRGVLRNGQCVGTATTGTCTYANLDKDAYIRVEANLLPRNGGFPLTNILGLVSSGDVRLVDVADAQMAVLAYAGDQAIVNRQTILAGALVADNFHLGNNVPKVAYHPDIATAVQNSCAGISPTTHFAWGLIGTVCYTDAVESPGSGFTYNPGVLSDISVERR